MTNEISIEVLKTLPVVKIEGPDDLKKAVEVLSVLNKELDKLVEDRERITKPLNESLKEVRARYKPAVEALEARIDELREKMGKYQTRVLKERQEAEDKLAARIGEGKGKLKMETAVKKIGELETVDKSVDSVEGSATFVAVKKFKVVDLSKVPLELHLANETEIRRLMNNGVEVEGVEYWTEQSVRNSR